MISCNSVMPGSAVPKAISPVQEQIEGLTSAQDVTHQSLDHLMNRLSVVLRDPEPVADGPERTESPQSPLVEALLSRRDAAVSIDRRINDILMRLTI